VRWQDAGVLETPVVLTTRLPGQVVFSRLTSADADAFAAHVSADLPRLRTHLPWPDATSTPEGAAGWLGAYERQEDGRVGVGGMWHEGGLVSAGCRWLLGYARADLRGERLDTDVLSLVGAELDPFVRR
jgi:hypothetical protein